MNPYVSIVGGRGRGRRCCSAWWTLIRRSRLSTKRDLSPATGGSIGCGSAGKTGALCDFLGLPYHDAMLKFYEGREKADPSLDAKQAWRPVTPGLRDWRSQMTLDDIERFEAVAGDLLDDLGYPRAVPNPPQEKLVNATEDPSRLHSRDPDAKGMRLPSALVSHESRAAISSLTAHRDPAARAAGSCSDAYKGGG